MKFEDVYGRCYRGDLSQAEASEILGMSERTFRRWRERYEAEGAAGLYDRRLGRVSARRAPVDEVMRVLELFETRYPDFTAKHFHEKLVCEHGFGLSYNWLRLSLQAHGKIKPAPRRGAHRRKRPRRPVVGMMLHQDRDRGSSDARPWRRGRKPCRRRPRRQEASARPSSPARSGTMTPSSDTEALTASCGTPSASRMLSSVSGPRVSQRSCMVRVRRCRVLTDGVHAGRVR